MDCCAGIVMYWSFHYYHWLYMCFCKLHREQLLVDAVCLIRICSFISLYFQVLTLPFHTISAPMNCFVMCMQPLVVIALCKSPEFQGAITAELEATSHTVLKFILTGYILEPGLHLLYHSTILSGKLIYGFSLLNLKLETYSVVIDLTICTLILFGSAKTEIHITHIATCVLPRLLPHILHVCTHSRG